MHPVLSTLWPAASAVRWREQARAALGTVLAIVLTGTLSRWLLGADTASVWLVAPMGASALLLMAMPASPLTQPWPVLAGNTVSALVGIAVTHWGAQPQIAAGIAVGAALTMMFALRCVHPPGGAVALLTVLTHTHDWQFALLPVLLNSAVLVVFAVLYNRMTGHTYPHPRAPALLQDAASPRFTTDDLDAALRHYNEVLDIDRDDLQSLLHEAQAHAYQRTLGQLQCRDIMSRTPVTLRGQDTLAQAREKLLTHDIKALPVVDAQSHVVGILSRVDLYRHPNAQPDTAVRSVMTRQVRVASDSTRLIGLLPLFSREGHHHLPIVDEHQVLVGMVTQSDVIRALHRAVV